MSLSFSPSVQRTARSVSYTHLGLNGGGLQGVGGGVALDTRLGSGDFQLNKVGDLNAENLALVAQQLAGIVLLAELEVVGHIGSANGDVVVGLNIHEVVQIAILVGVGGR